MDTLRMRTAAAAAARCFILSYPVLFLICILLPLKLCRGELGGGGGVRGGGCLLSG